MLYCFREVIGLKSRIKEIRLHPSVNLSQEAFGKRIGVSGAAISRIESGDRNVTESMIKLICREYNVSYDWLKYGDGEMYIDADDESIDAAIDEMMAGENETAKAVFRAFAKMDESDWAAIKKLILAISDDLKK